MIHQHDVVGAIIATLQNGQPGEIYNATDDEPVQQVKFLQFLADSLSRDMPPTASADEIHSKKRGVTDKQITNQRLRQELGYTLKYPTFREGYAAEITRLKASTNLN